MPRYIDADELLEHMRRYRQHSVAYEYIKSLAPASIVPKPQWVSVEDRLPDIYEEVLVYCGEGVFDICWRMMSGQWQAHCRMYDMDAVSHWMPLPKCPEEVSECS